MLESLPFPIEYLVLALLSESFDHMCEGLFLGFLFSSIGLYVFGNNFNIKYIFEIMLK